MLRARRLAGRRGIGYRCTVLIARLRSYLAEALVIHRASGGESIAALDGLRGFAVLLVLLSHMSRAGLRLHPSLDLVGMGKYGVYLFFVLSSFLLSLQFVAGGPDAVRSAGRWGLYFARRILRVYPLFLCALLIGSNNAFFGHALFGPREVTVLGHVFLQEGAKIFWAIPVEMKFYAVLPVLVGLYVVVARRRPWVALAFVAACVVVREIYFPARFLFGHPIALTPYLSVFLFGHAAAIVYHHFGERIESQAVRVSLEAVGLIALVAVLATGPGIYKAWAGGGGIHYRFLAEVSWYGLAWSVFLLATLLGSGLLRRVLVTRAMRFIGIVSFSVYLWHLPVIEYVRREPLDHYTKIVVTLVAVAAISTLSYLLIERPFINFGRRLSRRREASG